MKHTLINRVLSFVLVFTMLIAMVAVAPLASAVTIPALTFGMDVYEYDNNGTAEVRVSIYMTGYEQWNFENEGIDLLQFRVNFDNTKLTFVTSMGGIGEYKAFTAPSGMTVTASNKNSAQAANDNGYVVFMTDAGVGEDDETGETYALYIPQGEKVYLRTYTFTVKEGATGDCKFSYTTDYFFVTDFFHNSTKIVNKTLPATWTANGGTHTIPSTEPEIPTITVNFSNRDLGNQAYLTGSMAPISGQGSVIVPEPTFTLGTPGFAFMYWVDTANNYKQYRPGDEITVSTTLTPMYSREFTLTYDANGGQGTMEPTKGAQPAAAENGFTREGYTFKTWNTAADGSGFNYAPGAVIGTNVTLYAIWEQNAVAPTEYTINYNANGGSGTMEATKGTAPAVAANGFTREGYTFKTWNTKADGTGENVAVGTALTADTTLYAIWEKVAPTEYTINYNANGGSGTMEATKGTAPVVANVGFTAPQGYVFAGWNTQADGKGENVAVGTTLTADTTLYAIWNLIPVDPSIIAPLTFGMDITEENGEIKVAVYMTGYDKWNFAYHGIDCIQFFLNFDNTKLTFVSSAKGNAFTAPNGMTVTATGKTNAASANENGYVAFMTDAGIGEDDETGEPIALYIPQGEKVYLRTYTFTVIDDAEGDCAFSFNTTKFYVTDYFHNMNKIANGTLPEGWSANGATYTIKGVEKFTITYNANGGQGTMDATVAVAPVVAENLFTREGYTFIGWNTKADGTGETVAAGTALTANTTLYATWKQNEYTITYDANGGEGTMDATVAVAPVVAENLFNRNGYTFIGWNTKADGTGETVKAGATLAANTTLYAIWEKDIVIIYDANGGTGTMEYTKAENGKLVVAEFAFTAPQGKVFLYWTDADGKIYNAGDELPAEQITLYAQYHNPFESFTVTFVYKNAQGEEVTKSFVVGSGESAANLMTDPELYGFIFTGWDGDLSCITADTTVNAKWTEDPNPGAPETGVNTTVFVVLCVVASLALAGACTLVYLKKKAVK